MPQLLNSNKLPGLAASIFADPNWKTERKSPTNGKLYDGAALNLGFSQEDWEGKQAHDPDEMDWTDTKIDEIMNAARWNVRGNDGLKSLAVDAFLASFPRETRQLVEAIERRQRRRQQGAMKGGKVEQRKRDFKVGKHQHPEERNGHRISRARRQTRAERRARRVARRRKSVKLHTNADVEMGDAPDFEDAQRVQSFAGCLTDAAATPPSSSSCNHVGLGNNSVVQSVQLAFDVAKPAVSQEVEIENDGDAQDDSPSAAHRTMLGVSSRSAAAPPSQRPQHLGAAPISSVITASVPHFGLQSNLVDQKSLATATPAQPKVILADSNTSSVPCSVSTSESQSSGFELTSAVRAAPGIAVVVGTSSNSTQPKHPVAGATTFATRRHTSAVNLTSSMFAQVGTTTTPPASNAFNPEKLRHVTTEQISFPMAAVQCSTNAESVASPSQVPNVSVGISTGPVRHSSNRTMPKHKVNAPILITTLPAQADQRNFSHMTPASTPTQRKASGEASAPPAFAPVSMPDPKAIPTPPNTPVDASAAASSAMFSLGTAPLASKLRPSSLSFDGRRSKPVTSRRRLATSDVTITPSKSQNNLEEALKDNDAPSKRRNPALDNGAPKWSGIHTPANFPKQQALQDAIPDAHKDIVEQFLSQQNISYQQESSAIVNDLADLILHGPGASFEPPTRDNQTPSRAVRAQHIKFYKEVRRDDPELWDLFVGLAAQSVSKVDQLLDIMTREVLQGQKWSIDYLRIDEIFKSCPNPLERQRQRDNHFFSRRSSSQKHQDGLQAFDKKLQETGGWNTFVRTVGQWAGDNPSEFQNILRKAGWCPVWEQEKHRKFVEYVISEMIEGPVRTKCVQVLEAEYRRFFRYVAKSMKAKPKHDVKFELSGQA